MSARPVPPPDALSEAFWAATRAQRLVQARCSGCQRFLGYPRERCHFCGSTHVEWCAVSGRGRIVAVTVVHRSADPHWSARTPYAVSLVELDEGPRLLSSPPDGVDPAAVPVGTRVEVTWEPLADGRAYPWFRPAEEPRSRIGLE